jgi:hypothetical protein
VKPLGFVDWRSVNRYFCVLMWFVAFVLALIVLTHLGHTAQAAHPSANVIAR